MSEVVQDNHNVCSNCGASALESGYLDAPGGGKVRFQFEKGAFLGFRLRHGPRVQGRCCTVCGNLQLFVENAAQY